MSEREDIDRRLARRRRERQAFLSLSSMFAIALLIGIVTAVWLSWSVFPLSQPVGSPAVFRTDYRQDYIYMVSESLAQNGDFEQAKARLELLEEPDLPQTIVLELERYLREGRPADEVRHMARLAQGLGAEGAALDLFAPTVVPDTVAAIPTPTRIDQIAESGSPETEATATATLLPTPTTIIEPTNTPIPVETLSSAQLAFQLIDQEEVCTPLEELVEIEVFVQDSEGDGLAGQQIVVSWDEGQDQFVTGLKREIDAGYADFTMSAGISYSAELLAGSNRVSGLTASPCDDGTGQTGWRLTFQQVEE